MTEVPIERILTRTFRMEGTFCLPFSFRDKSSASFSEQPVLFSEILRTYYSINSMIYPFAVTVLIQTIGGNPLPLSEKLMLMMACDLCRLALDTMSA